MSGGQVAKAQATAKGVGVERKVNGLELGAFESPGKIRSSAFVPVYNLFYFKDFAGEAIDFFVRCI